MVAAWSLSSSPAAIGAWSGSRGFIASAHAALLPPAIKEPITSNAIRIFMMPFPRRERARLSECSASGRRRDSGLLLHRHRDGAGCRETNLVAFHIGPEAVVDVVIMASVPTLATVSLGQFDAILFDPVDGADMDAVRANHFHMLFDTAHDGHSGCPVC